jgi:hypothetical protein
MIAELRRHDVHSVHFQPQTPKPQPWKSSKYPKGAMSYMDLALEPIPRRYSLGATGDVLRQVSTMQDYIPNRDKEMSARCICRIMIGIIFFFFCTWIYSTM